jgi:hypothetical protein
MLSATVLAIFFVPVFFVATRKLFVGIPTQHDSPVPLHPGEGAEQPT